MIAQDRGTQKNFNNRQTVCLLLSALIWDKNGQPNGQKQMCKNCGIY